MEEQVKKPIHLSIVIPAYNEEKRLPKTLSDAVALLREQPYESEIIVVSDGSTDGTRGVVESFMNGFPQLRLIEYFPNAGKGAAVRTGMLEAKGEYRLFMDADSAVSIDYAPTFLSMISHKYDIVIGSRGLRKSEIQHHQPFLRELAAKGFGVLQRMIIDLPFSDTQCGFKLFTKEAAERLFSKTTFNCAYFDAELLYIAYGSKMRIGEVGVRWNHDGETRLPIGIGRTFDILRKLFMIKRIHRNGSPG